MDDLVVTLFMADNGLTDFEAAEAMMLRYGLGDEYVDFAAKLHPFLEDDNRAAFAEGVEFAHDMVVSAKFDPAVIKSPNFAEGVEFAMVAVDAILHCCMDGANMTDAELASVASAR